MQLIQRAMKMVGLMSEKDERTRRIVGSTTARAGNTGNIDDVLADYGVDSRDALGHIARDEEIETMATIRRSAMREVPWAIDGVSKELSREIKHMLMKHMSELINLTFEVHQYGRAHAEIVWSLVNGKLVPRSILGLPYSYFHVVAADEVEQYEALPGSVMYMADILYPLGIDIETEPYNVKVLGAINAPTHDNPNGRSALAHMFFLWLFKRRVLKMWPEAIHRFANPLVVGKTTGNLGAFVGDILSTLGQGVIGVDKEDVIEFIKSDMKAGGGTPHESFLNFINTQIQRFYLGNNLTTQMGSTGSYAAAQSALRITGFITRNDVGTLQQLAQGLTDAYMIMNKMKTGSALVEFELGRDADEQSASVDQILARDLGVRFNAKYIATRYRRAPEHFTIEKVEKAPFPVGLHEDSQMAARLAIARSKLPIKKRFALPTAVDPDALKGALKGAKDEDAVMERLLAFIGAPGTDLERHLANLFATSKAIGEQGVKGVDKDV